METDTIVTLVTNNNNNTFLFAIKNANLATVLYTVPPPLNKMFRELAWCSMNSVRNSDIKFVL